MKRFSLFVCGLLLSLSVLNVAIANPIVYSNDFENLADFSKWSDNLLATTNDYGFPSTQYHGNYTTTGNTTLTLTGLGAHTELTLDFDLYLFYTWDGEGNIGNGKDYFSLSGDINGNWTFSNHQNQSYDGTPDETYGTGPTQTQVYRDLGLTGVDNGFTIAHTGDTFSVTFGGPTTQTDEWWGIDNVSVSIDSSPVPEPASMLLFGIGLLGLAGINRKKK